MNPIPSPEILASNAGELSALPDSWRQVDVVLARPAATSSQIAETIAGDPGLAARLLRLANSPLFGLAQRVERLSQAVHLVGTRQLRELALASTVVDLLASGPGDRQHLQAFLRHSTATGLIARNFAARRREVNVERFFVAGLLHDLGRLVLVRQLPELAAETERTALARREPIERVEADLLGYNHAAVSAALLNRWRLPVSLTEPVACHHQPGLAMTFRVETAAIHVASLVTGLVGIGSGLGLSTPLDPRAWDALGLAPVDLVEAITEAADHLDAMLGILGGQG